MNWLKDFVDIPEISARELGNLFTMGAAEVEKIEMVGEHLSKITVCEITQIDAHPQADKLQLVTFKISADKTKQVVCGAANVKVGMKAPYAPLGTAFPSGLVLEPKKIRGVLSEGMLCSENELGISAESSGIMALSPEAPIGECILSLLGLNSDVILDVDNKSLTHRPDLWGIFGIAREFAALLQTHLKNRFSDSWRESLEKNFTNDESPIVPQVDQESSGLSYFGLSLSKVTVKESPDWMQRRLISVGLRPINNIVDISNYVMVELGIPLHIFDRDQIKGSQIKIHKIGSEQKFVTLDEEERELISSDTVISDSQRVLVLGGIMGGLNSGVTETTTNIFIEVANWKAAQVRRTSTRLGLRTDSSQRYEKSLDSKLCYRTLLRTLELIKELCPDAQVIGRAEYDGIDLDAIPALKIKTKRSHICRCLGTEVSAQRIEQIFHSLDFAVTQINEDEMEISVPSFRATKDVECEADLVEEIGRIIGYDSITPIAPAVQVTPVKRSEAQKLERKIKSFLSLHASCFEIITYPLVGSQLIEKASCSVASPLKLINALSTDAEIMRPSLFPSLLNAAALNSKYSGDFRFFETGRSYIKDQKNFSKELFQLGIIYFSREANPFMDLVNDSERLLQFLNLPTDLARQHPKHKNRVIDQEGSITHPIEFYNIRLMGKMDGAIFSVHPILLRKFKIKGSAACMLLDLTNVVDKKLKDKTSYRPLNKFPIVNFDYTVVVDQKTEIGSILETLCTIKIKEAQHHQIVKVYTDDTGLRSVTLRSIMYDPERTLPGDLIKKIEETIVDRLNQSGFPLKSRQ